MYWGPLERRRHALRLVEALTADVGEKGPGAALKR
jgi:hypothetical protein